MVSSTMPSVLPLQKGKKCTITPGSSAVMPEDSQDIEVPHGNQDSSDDEVIELPQVEAAVKTVGLNYSGRRSSFDLEREDEIRYEPSGL